MAMILSTVNPKSFIYLFKLSFHEKKLYRNFVFFLSDLGFDLQQSVFSIMRNFGIY
jgi:hypothetical protein